MRIYVAGPYSHKTAAEREQYVNQGREAVAELIKRGHSPICTYAMCDGMEHGTGITYEEFMRMDFDFVEMCEGIFMCPRWENSPGANRELAFAQSLGKTIFYGADDL